MTGWKPSGEPCPNCGKTMLKDHEYEQCYGCTPNSKIVRDSVNGGLTAREREVQQEIAHTIETDGEVKIELW